MTGIARFTIRANAEPQTLPRLINYVAQLGLVPSSVRAREDNGIMIVSIKQAGLGGRQANVIAERMRSSVAVEHVALSLVRCSPNTRDKTLP